MDLSIIQDIKPKNALMFSITICKIANLITDELRGMTKEDINKLKYDEEFLCNVCSIVENVFTDKKGKLRKKEFVIEILKKVINNITDEDKLIIGNKIEFIHSNELIRQIKTSEKLFNLLIRFLFKKD